MSDTLREMLGHVEVMEDLRPSGSDKNPHGKLYGWIRFGGVDFHVEAIQVRYRESKEYETIQYAVLNSNYHYYQEFQRALDTGAFREMKINNKMYVMFIYPFDQ